MQLSPERITDAALDILDEYGLADVSMRRVASSLGVAPGALYWHIANKQELIASMAAHIVGPLLRADVPHPRELATELREAVLKVRDGAEVVVAAMSQPDAPVHAALEARFAESVEAWAGTEASRSDARAAALGLLHLTLGEAAVHQASSQLAELTGGAVIDASGARQTHLTAVNLLLDGLSGRI